jgi:hypothetical protein
MAFDVLLLSQTWAMVSFGLHFMHFAMHLQDWARLAASGQ